MDALDEAGLDYERFKYETLFAAGLMLYAGEGNRVSRHSIRLANVDPGIHRVFLRFIEKYLKINVSNVKFSILLYPDLDAGACISYWIKELGVVKGNIHKPQVIKGRDVSGKKLHFGVGTSIISNSFLKKKLMYWVEKFKEDFGAAHAAID